jgi:CRISPR-associated exonuclease Cas4
MSTYSDDDLLPISGIQHFAFCRRQWALIHIEQQWSDNALTIGGDFMHERAHNEKAHEVRDGVHTVRGLSVASRVLGLTGKCDVVEFHPCDDGIPLRGKKGLFTPYPVEYKSGQSKADDCDRLQLCAQAMCLEEMLACAIPEGALYYGKTRRREEVELDEPLREAVRAAAGEMHAMFMRRHTPRVRTGKHCKRCSLADLCLPSLGLARSAAAYIRERAGE